MTIFSKVRETLNALPVATIADDVVKSVMAGNVTITAAPTGSGKSMLLPAMLAEATEEQVVVLVPRRFLATDAAKNVAEMAECAVGSDVGFAVGKMTGEHSQFSEKTKLLFVTYGYAISSGLINTAKNIALDEVHEAAEDISLARAILHERKKNDPSLRLLEMSATIDAKRQAGYWSDVAKTHIETVEGQTLPCEVRRQTPGKDGKTIASTVTDLLTKESRNGIAVFCPGIKEVERAVEEIREMVKSKDIPNVEVVQIYGGTPADERAKARATPKPGWKKVIVGTNVIESGVNLRWVDAGVSDGFGKIPYDRPDTGAAALILENLPQWRVVQQQGRINRDAVATGFASGIFILHSNEAMEHRAHQATPELERCSLTQFAFHAASLGYTPDTLHVDARIEPSRWCEAKADLMRLGLIHEDWSLTKDGKYVAKLPLSPETGAMLCEAHRMDVMALRSDDAALKNRPKLLPDAIILAALAEQGGLHENYTRSHGLDGKSDIHGGSDLIDGLKAYLRLESTPAAQMVARTAETLASGNEQKISWLDSARAALKEQCKELNVDYNGFCDAMLLVGEIRERQKDKKAIEVDDEREFDAGRYNALKQIILNGSANRLFQLEESGDEEPTYRDLLRDYDRRKSDKGNRFGDYPISGFSALKDTQKTALTPFMLGKLREFLVKKSSGAQEPVLVINQATSIPAEVFLAWAAEHEPPLLSNAKISKENVFTARYAERTNFAITLTKRTQDIAENIVANSADNWANIENTSEHWAEDSLKPPPKWQR